VSRSDAGPAILARRVSKRFLLRHNRVVALKDRLLGVFEEGRRERIEPFWALTDVSLQVQPGECVGLVGRNGSGKSTLLKLIAGIFAPTSGALYVQSAARVGTMIELGVGFHHELTAIENIYLNASIHGLERREIAALVPSIVEYSGLANFMDVPLKGFSSGMHMRLAFAIAANLRPDILLIDEVFAVGDADFQKRCVATVRAFLARGCTVLFVSHAPAAVREVCTRAVVLQAGRVRFDGSVKDGLAHYAELVALEHSTALPGGASRQAPGTDPERAPSALE
jgi:ABC-type polysaccharide/polyol phosphate transport system ATPase subunit